jgi:hypothetical protein
MAAVHCQVDFCPCLSREGLANVCQPCPDQKTPVPKGNVDQGRGALASVINYLRPHRAIQDAWPAEEGPAQEEGGPGEAGAARKTSGLAQGALPGSQNPNEG